MQTKSGLHVELTDAGVDSKEKRFDLPVGFIGSLFFSCESKRIVNQSASTVPIFLK